MEICEAPTWPNGSNTAVSLHISMNGIFEDQMGPSRNNNPSQQAVEDIEGSLEYYYFNQPVPVRVDPQRGVATRVNEIRVSVDTRDDSGLISQPANASDIVCNFGIGDDDDSLWTIGSLTKSKATSGLTSFDEMSDSDLTSK